MTVDFFWHMTCNGIGSGPKKRRSAMSAKNKKDSEGNLRVQCKECEGWYHRLGIHVSRKHGMNIEEYLEKYPGAKTLSEFASGRREETVATEVKREEEAYKVGVAKINKREDLGENERQFVPVHDEKWIVGKNEMEQLEDLAVGIEDGDNVYIGGPTGCGKTTMVKELASLINQPIRIIQLTRDFKVSQFIGRSDLVIDEEGNQITTFKYGILPLCMKNGWWLVLNEPDHAAPDVNMALQIVLEGDDLTLTENFGEVVGRHPNFRIIATANTFGHGDDTGLYVGVKHQNEATIDRFQTTIKAGYPGKKNEAKILAKRSGLAMAKTTKMVEVAHKIRKSFIEEECYCTFSTRRLIAWAIKAKRYNNVRRASRIAVLNKIEDDDARFVDGIIQRYFGSEV